LILDLVQRLLRLAPRCRRLVGSDAEVAQVRPARGHEREDREEREQAHRAAPIAALLHEHVPFREPEPDHEERHRDDDEQEDREEVVADASRR
jgi:hypothetical protein